MKMKNIAARMIIAETLVLCDAREAITCRLFLYGKVL